MITSGVFSWYPGDVEELEVRGYGLPIANEIVEAHGGRLHIVSTPRDEKARVGTTVVSIMLPLAYDPME
jgi:nitrogen fixation/metabolism regulation signal transduction histidine kinase